ncbi:MAG TPA: lipocalin family protein [Solimonas sp.]|nr:lipocalin family protein [Solimonas sp.]
MRLIPALCALLLLAGCASPAPLPTVGQVDLQRYMGDWYVIANIPPWIEKEAVNSVENYRLDEDGNVPTVFTYRKKTFDGPLKTLTNTAYVVNRQTNAEWGVQFIWPIKAEYRIAWLAPDYSQVIVARSKRDYVWLMARTPQIPEAEYRALKQRIADMGYDESKLRLVPQRWPEAQPR